MANLTININVTISESSDIDKLTAKLRDLHARVLDLDKVSNVSISQASNRETSSVEMLRQKWTQLTGRQRFKMTKEQKELKDRGERTEEQILQEAIDRIVSGAMQSDEENGPAILPNDDGKHPYE